MTTFPEPRTFLDEVLVECPRCTHRAVVRAGSRAPRLTCAHCGYAREADSETPRLTWWSVRPDGREPSFGRPLWLAEECCGGNVLSALNEPHLNYLERFIRSTTRDRDFPSPPGDRGLAYKLPKWMQLARNREELLRTISRLRRRLAYASGASAWRQMQQAPAGERSSGAVGAALPTSRCRVASKRAATPAGGGTTVRGAR